jgi:hypothetical protein
MEVKNILAKKNSLEVKLDFKQELPMVARGSINYSRFKHSMVIVVKGFDFIKEFNLKIRFVIGEIGFRT